MNFVNNTSNKEINIEITPLIDIVFLLVIFFVVTSKIDSSQAIDIDLPNTSSFMNQSQLSSNTIFLYENGSLIYKDLTLTINEVEPLMNFIANNISNEEKIISKGKGTGSGLPMSRLPQSPRHRKRKEVIGWRIRRQAEAHATAETLSQKGWV